MPNSQKSDLPADSTVNENMCSFQKNPPELSLC